MVLDFSMFDAVVWYCISHSKWYLFHQHSPKSIENFGFRCFFVAKTLKKVWVKMWVNCLTHTVTHIGW